MISLEKTRNESPSSASRSTVKRTTMLTTKKDEVRFAPNPFEKIEVLDLRINKPRVLKFVVKNTSGLDTKFDLKVENYEPLEHREEELTLN